MKSFAEDLSDFTEEAKSFFYYLDSLYHPKKYRLNFESDLFPTEPEKESHFTRLKLALTYFLLRSPRVQITHERKNHYKAGTKP